MEHAAKQTLPAITPRWRSESPEAATDCLHLTARTGFTNPRRKEIWSCNQAFDTGPDSPGLGRRSRVPSRRAMNICRELTGRESSVTGKRVSRIRWSRFRGQARSSGSRGESRRLVESCNSSRQPIGTEFASLRLLSKLPEFRRFKLRTSTNRQAKQTISDGRSTSCLKSCPTLCHSKSVN